MTKKELLPALALAVLAAGLFLAAEAAATTITLVNGKEFSGDIVSETSAAVVLSINGNNVTIFKSTIAKREDAPSPAPSAAAPATAPAAETAPAAIPSATPADTGLTPVSPETAADQTPAAAPQTVADPEQAPAATPLEPVVPTMAAVPRSGGIYTAAIAFSTSTEPGYTWNYKAKSGTSSSQNNFSLLLSLGIQPGKLVEYRPAFGMRQYSTRSIASDSTGEIASSESTWSIWGLAGSFGVYFHLVDNEHFGFSFGPDLSLGNYFTPTVKNADTVSMQYKSYYNYFVSIGMPMNLDIRLSSWFGFRMVMSLVSFDVDILYQKDEKNTFDKSALDFNFNMATQWVPTIGCVFIF